MGWRAECPPLRRVREGQSGWQSVSTWGSASCWALGGVWDSTEVRTTCAPREGGWHEIEKEENDHRRCRVPLSICVAGLSNKDMSLERRLAGLLGVGAVWGTGH